MWPALAIAGVSALSNYKKGKAGEKFAQQQLDVQNMENRDLWNMRQQEYYANLEAKMQQMQGMVEAGRAGLQSRQDAFGITKEAAEAEKAQQEKFAKALVDFGNENKEVNLEEAKAKRSGRASKAARGSKVSGTGGRAGRMSGAFRSGAKQAIASGLAEAGTRSGMEAAMRGYGADMDRERGLFADMSGDAAMAGENIRNKEKLADYRLRLGSQEQQSLADSAQARYAMDSANAGLLNRPGPTQTYGGAPKTGIWDNLGAAAGIAGAAYGNGAFNAPQTGAGYTYGSGSKYPDRYFGAPTSKQYPEWGRL